MSEDPTDTLTADGGLASALDDEQLPRTGTFQPQYQGFPIVDEPPLDLPRDNWSWREDGWMFDDSEQRERVTARVDEFVERMFPVWLSTGASWKTGSFDLGWLTDDKDHWGKREVEISKRGLTVLDINKVVDAGRPVPDRSDRVGESIRGAPITQPMMHTIRRPLINRRIHAWADSAAPLYEEAVARQWNATRDIPWESIKSELRHVPYSVNKANAMLATMLAQLEVDAGLGACSILPFISHEYQETIWFHLTQGMDEARHAEVFKKRAVLGGGITGTFTNTDFAAFLVLNAQSMEWLNFFLQGAGEGAILSLFRMGEYISPTSGDKEIYRRCMQDEARHVSFGQMRLRAYMQGIEDKQRAQEEIQVCARTTDCFFLQFFTDPDVAEPIAVLAGGGVEKIDDGMEWLRTFYQVVRDDYLNRCDSMGVDNWRAKTLLPPVAPF